MMTSSFMSPIRWMAVLLTVCAFSAAQDKTFTSTAASGTSPTAPAAANTAQPTAAKTDFHQRTPRYRIESGDTFDITFDLSPEFNQTAVAVQPDGYVTLRAVGDLQVAGQTVPELTQTLKTAYSKILNDPPISVILKDFEKPYFVADGQVAKPGKYDMHGQVTLTEAIAIAGGFQSSAKHSQVLLFRRVDDQWTEAKLINVKKMEKHGDLKEDPFLHPGDMVFVPKTVLSKIDRFIPNLSMGSYLPLAIP
ncbi:MAG TPA: polysaccharide biosynthesis/export family protein [Candidatus Sulfotelmatobacter sp.]|jgi:protein involved in polysaccharide export with SLBB domain|nr:polysaccharide biosynthesis/export family protein [Candidatus Sulfotelmatobacter sp.]